ncbi:TraR/DksA C4-type zinc finger protein [Vibrio sp. Makdt]|uniref:TraR/DksA C4-type zinc finger protein n=1 Tax=Vibrio sp. Makdt TaxID=2998828 RepID=UPI0022CD6003|nr:TraR/DksA C4-type zinc finger protein [Vibrio sp. Makdt]MDA0152293.1 TraR/DksA C4-type zinc finger protein [Vibrio sp. Makdt]
MLSAKRFMCHGKIFSVKELGDILPLMLTQTRADHDAKKVDLRTVKENIAGTSDPVDISEMNIEQRNLESEINKLVSDSNSIRTVIDLYECGDYGFCDGCGIEINLDRLNAYPTTTECVDCKTISELKEKQKHH